MASRIIFGNDINIYKKRIDGLGWCTVGYVDDSCKKHRMPTVVDELATTQRSNSAS